MCRGRPDGSGRRKHDACPCAARVPFCPACQQPLIREATISTRTCASSAPGCTTCGPSTWPPRATRSSRSPGSPGRASRRWPSARSTPRRSAATSSRSRPYARRLLLPAGAPKVDDITGLPPAVALQQRRGSATSRSTVGTVTTLSNLLRMLFSRAGTYPPGATERLDSDCVLAEHRDRRVPGVPRARPDPPGHRGDAGARPVADHPRGRRRRVARRVAGPEPARHPHHARLRHRQAVAQAAEAATRLDPVHRRAADRRDRPEPAPGHRRLLLQRHVLQRRTPRPAHAGQLAERDDAPPRAAVRRQRRLPGVRRLRAAARGAGGHVRRPQHRRAASRCR